MTFNPLPLSRAVGFAMVDVLCQESFLVFQFLAASEIGGVAPHMRP